MPLDQILQTLWINEYWLKQIALYLFISLPLLIAIFYFSTILEINKYIKKLKNGWGILELIQKELLKENNISLSIFLGSKFLAIAIIISHAMVFNIVWVILFSIVAYLFQILTVYIFEKLMWVKSLTAHILEEQNIWTAILYWFLVVWVSMLIWTSLT